MGKDIFEAYIRKLNLPDLSLAATHGRLHSLETAEEQEPAAESSGKNQQGEALAVLRDISRKLDYVHERTADSRMDADLAIVNGKVILPDCGIFPADVYVRDGKVSGIGRQENMRVKRTIDASGKYVCPGIIDPHVHLGLFASMEEDMLSETKAAIMGGITTMGVFFGGEQSHFATFPEIRTLAKRVSYTDIIPHLVIAGIEQRKEIRDYVKHLGVTSFKVYMNGIPGMIPSVDDGFIMDVFDEMRQSGKSCVLCCHTENSYLVERALRKTREECGDTGTIEDWAKTHPAMAEEEAVMRIAYLAEQAKMPLYMVHIGTKEGIERIRQLKPFNPYIHAETTSPYLTVAGNQRKNTLYKMEPPLRGTEDQEALFRALQDGVIDTIGTDNVCETSKEKKADRLIWDVVPGYSVVETHLASVITEGVIGRGISLEKVITHMTKRPAEIFGVYPKKGTLLPGSDADIVILDMNLEREVHGESMATRSDFSIYEGRRLRGWPQTVIKGGCVVMENGMLSDEIPAGHMLKR